MDKISEADNEDEKYNTLFDKINDELRNKEDYKIDEKNIDELIGKDNNIKKGNVKDYFDPCLYNITDEHRKDYLNRNKFKNYKNDNNSVNKSDLSPRHLMTDPIEVRH